jgi:hypothetical protein
LGGGFYPFVNWKVGRIPGGGHKEIGHLEPPDHSKEWLLVAGSGRNWHRVVENPRSTQQRVVCGDKEKKPHHVGGSKVRISRIARIAQAAERVPRKD